MIPHPSSRRRHRRMALPAAAAIVAGGLGLAGAGGSTPAQAAADPSCPWVGSSAPIAQRVNQLLSRMSLADEVAIVHGYSGSPYVGYVAPIARLCFPGLALEDGPAGVADGMTGVTQLPAPVALAAAWSPSLARRYGGVIGAEEAGKGADVDLGPTVNIVRDPRWGRAFESLGEDPYLTSKIGVGDIRGIQGQGEMAQVKHLDAYNQETNRNTPQDDVRVNHRTLQEIYLPAFAAAVEQGHVSSAMCSYNEINGPFACQSDYTQNTVLKDQFGFDGFITSDWGATHSTVPSARHGLDMQMPDDSYFGADLKTAVLNGEVPRSRVDDMVRRITREMFRFGLFDHPRSRTPDATVTTAAHARTARVVAEQGTTLLKNSGNVLPLSASSAQSIAVIGQSGRDTVASAGGGSAAVTAPYVVSPVRGITERAGSGVSVSYAPGTLPSGGLPAVPSSALTPADGSGQGLTGAYYADMDLSGSPALTRTDPDVDFDWGGGAAGPGLPSDQFSARWTGTITPPATGTYTFSLTSDDGSRLFINGHRIIDNWRDQAATTETGTVHLTQGKPARIEVQYYDDGGDASVSLGWFTPGQATPADTAVALAKKSDVAVVFASKEESEGADLDDITLPDNQDQLISRVAAANPHTIVVLNTGSAVQMPWIGKVAGVLEAWYPGQTDGHAIASVLFGDTDPGGRLPVTFPRSLSQVPAHTAARWPGVNGKVHYSEGLLVGYRWYDAKGITPLFPFGYGLSYTSFRMDRVAVQPAGAGATVSVRVTNTGSRSGTTVAQVYVHQPKGSGEPPEQLAGFRRVTLPAGASRTLTVHLDARSFQHFGGDRAGWVTTRGTYQVSVGSSSRDFAATVPLRRG